MKLYHAGKEKIRKPDLHRGRKNADFGQGFYKAEQQSTTSIGASAPHGCG